MGGWKRRMASGTQTRANAHTNRLVAPAIKHAAAETLFKHTPGRLFHSVVVGVVVVCRFFEGIDRSRRGSGAPEATGSGCYCAKTPKSINCLTPFSCAVTLVNPPHHLHTDTHSCATPLRYYAEGFHTYWKESVRYPNRKVEIFFLVCFFLLYFLLLQLMEAAGQSCSCGFIQSKVLHCPGPQQSS